MDHQLVLSVVGVSVVGVAILSSYGLCFYLGIFYGPVHPTIPFLLLGIGVDDMFVIVQVNRHQTLVNASVTYPSLVPFKSSIK